MYLFLTPGHSPPPFPTHTLGSPDIEAIVHRDPERGAFQRLREW